MGVPRSVTDLTIQYTDDFSSTVFETENGEYIGLNMTSSRVFIEHVLKINEILTGYPWEGDPPTEQDVQSRWAISIENSYNDLTLWWGGIHENTPYAFPIFYLSF